LGGWRQQDVNVISTEWPPKVRKELENKQLQFAAVLVKLPWGMGLIIS
jgi:hypothetical protein